MLQKFPHSIEDMILVLANYLRQILRSFGNKVARILPCLTAKNAQSGTICFPRCKYLKERTNTVFCFPCQGISFVSLLQLNYNLERRYFSQNSLRPIQNGGLSRENWTMILGKEKLCKSGQNVGETREHWHKMVPFSLSGMVDHYFTILLRIHS